MTVRSGSMKMLVPMMILLAACGSRAAAPRVGASATPGATVETSPPPSPEPPEPSSQWLIVLRAAADPGGVRDDAETLGPVLGDAIQVAPGSCFTGLPSRFGGDHYIIGALGSTRSEVDELAAEAGIEPLFEGEVQVVCVD